MSLFGALSTATTALAAQQAAIQVTGNNIANVGNVNYAREQAVITPNVSTEIAGNIYVGDGASVTDVQRQVDDALNNRLRGATSDNQAAQTTATYVGQVQSTLNALSGSDLSDQMNTFFDSWSTLANDPTSAGQRQVVVQEGANLANYAQTLDGQLTALGTNVNQELPKLTNTADGLASQIAGLNVQIATAEGSASSQDASLRDQRDTAVGQLSQLMNVTAVEQPTGMVDVYVGSQPLVDGQTSRGLSLTTVYDSADVPTPTVTFTDDGGTVPVTSGQLGALQAVRGQIADTQGRIDTLTHNVIDQVNRLHSSGQGSAGVSAVVGSNQVADPTVALNAAGAKLDFAANTGSFVVHVTQANGATTSTLIPVNLKGAATDTTLNSLVASLNGVAGVTASVVDGGKLKVATTAAAATVSFSGDTSGTLAALGVNTFFTGTDASDVAVAADLQSDPSLVAAAKNGAAGDNGTAVALGNLGSAAVAALGGDSLDDYYQDVVNRVGTAAAAAQTNATAAQTVQDTLTAQQQALSGVSLDEETVNLLQQQQAFQAASRVVNAVDQMMQSLIEMV